MSRFNVFYTDAWLHVGVCGDEPAAEGSVKQLHLSVASDRLGDPTKEAGLHFGFEQHLMFSLVQESIEISACAHTWTLTPPHS